jgi:uncharacterized membrane protein
MNTEPKNIQLTSKIVWGALTFSLVTYGLVLHFTEKMTYFAMPSGQGEPIQMLALVAPVMIFVSLFLYKTLMAKAKSDQERFTPMVISLALNEGIAMVGFMATFTSADGNGFFYAANTLVAFIGNLLVFPSKH